MLLHVVWVFSRPRDLDLWKLMSLETLFVGVNILFCECCNIQKHSENAIEGTVPDISFWTLVWPFLLSPSKFSWYQTDQSPQEKKILRLESASHFCLGKPWLAMVGPSLGQRFWLVFCPKTRTELSLGGFRSKPEMWIPWWKVCSSRNAVPTGELNCPTKSSLIQTSAEEFSQERCDLCDVWHLHRPCQTGWKTPLNYI